MASKTHTSARTTLEL